jgi:hypothetical protein
MDELNKERKALQDNLNFVLLNFVRNVVKAQIKKTDDSYTIGYGPDWRDESELHSSVMIELGVRIYFIDKQRSDQPLHLLLALTDKLGQIFSSFDCPPFLHVLLRQSDDDFVTISSDEDLQVFERCSPLHFNYKNNDRLKELTQAVEKFLLLTSIKYS